MSHRICVGLDGTTTGDTALRRAMEEATAHGGELHACTMWWAADSLPGTVEHERERNEARARAIQDAAIERVSQGVSEVPDIVRHVEMGTPGPGLVSWSRDADMLVVGTTHKGVFKRTFAGSVSEYCIRHSTVPVLVVPHVPREMEA